jgi:hypothetical protein
MSAEPTTSSKLCTVCGIDCAGKPRIKDQQGRYICKECFDKAKQTRQTQKSPPAAGAPAEAAAIPADGDNSFLLAMGSKESTGTAGTKACPECGRAMPQNAVICVGCGFNTSTGKRLSVKVIKAKKEKGAPGAASKAVDASSAMLFSVIGGCIGGAIGAAIWAAIAYFTQLEIGWIAWAVGGLCGAGCSIGARGHSGATTGGVAAVIAVVSIMAGKYIAGNLILQSMGLANAPVEVWFPKLFGYFDILWFFFAVGTAFKVGSSDVGSGGST